MWPILIAALGIYGLKRYFDSKKTPAPTTSEGSPSAADSPLAAEGAGAPAPQDQGGGGGGGGGGSYDGIPAPVIDPIIQAAAKKPATAAVRRVTPETIAQQPTGIFATGLAARAASSPTAGILGATLVQAPAPMPAPSPSFTTAAPIATTTPVQTAPVIRPSFTTKTFGR